MTIESNEKVFKYSGLISIKDFSQAVGVPAIEIIKFFFLNGVNTTVNTALQEKDCIEICKLFNITFSLAEEKKEGFGEKYLDFSEEKDLIDFPPVVTIMGHVDHGKTTLLDAIRKSDVAKKEFANITQHIGAYQISYQGKFITFLDTPGHEAFTKMRALGGNIANIIVLVVSAVDGIQQQTIESIQHAKNANVKIVVFINKVDLGKSQLPELKQSLMKHDILLEEFGGDVLCVEGSALKKEGINNLLETILLLSEVDPQKTTTKDPAVGMIIELRVEKGLGNTATVILLRGKLKTGDFVVTSTCLGKVKTIFNDQKKPLKEIVPGQPAQISGFKETPDLADKFVSFKNEKEAKSFHDSVSQKKIEKMFDMKKPGDEEINLMICADVSGTLDAIKHVVEKYDIKVTSCSVGPISETNLQLAKVSNSILINFNQKVMPHISEIAKQDQTVIKNYKSIYQIEEDIVQLKENNKFVEKVESTLGKAEVVKTWYHSKVGTIAGCIVKSGSIPLKSKIKVWRNDEQLVVSTIKSFKTEAFEIKEAKESQECGIVVNNWNNIEVGDVIEAFEMVAKV